MFKKIINLSNLTLLVALALSAIAAYYSIIGLTAIFAAAVIPIIIMGSILEIAKITATVWLRRYWNKAGLIIKLYLVPAIISLAVITSMGIFGFLSKAHMDQNIPTGDIAAKVALLDEKVKTQRDNIKSAREALAQMDTQVNNVMNKGDTERSAERSVQIRRQQATERGKLQKEIEIANIAIGKLNEEKAPIASQLRKVEAEVGPVKYIAALIYGDNPDQNLLESAVRWVIILLVIVFDPLAIALVLAANQSKDWDEETDEIKKIDTFFNNGKKISQHLDENEKVVEDESILQKHPYLTKKFENFKNLNPIVAPPSYEADDGPLSGSQIDQLKKTVEPQLSFVQGDYNVSHPTLKNWNIDANILPPKEEYKEVTEFEGIKDPITKEWEQTGPEYTVQIPINPTKIETEGVTVIPEYYISGDYAVYQGKNMHVNVLKDLRPDLFKLTADLTTTPGIITTKFGTSFPKIANRGDIFVRVDALPNLVFKFNGSSWIAVNKNQSDTYLFNQEYIKYLIEKIDCGEYDIDLLSEHEKLQIEEYLSNQKS